MLFLGVLILFSVFSGNYNINGISFYPPAYIAMVGFLIVFLKVKIPSFFIKWIVVSIILIFLAMLMLIINPNLGNYVFFIKIRYVIKGILIPIGCAILILYYCIQYKVDKIIFSSAVLIALISQLSIITIQLLYPDFRILFLSFLTFDESWKDFIETASLGNFRVTGISGISIYDSSITYSLLFILLLPKLMKSDIHGYLGVLSILVVFCLAAMAGRTGLIIFLMILFSFYFNCINKYFLTSRLIMLVFLIFLFIIIYSSEDEVFWLISFAFEPIINLIESGSFSSESTDDFLSNHLFFPYLSNFIFGDGVWAQANISEMYGYEYKTDSGFILMYISYGLLGVVISIFLTFNIYKVIINSFCLILNSGEKKSFYILYFLIFVAIFSSALKGPIFFSEKIMTAIMILNVFNYLFNKRES